MERWLLAGAPLDTALAQQALALARPTIEEALAAPTVSGERVLHVVLLDPQSPPQSGRSFDQAVLVEQSFGAPPPWGADYREFARAKARLAWRWPRSPALSRPGQGRLGWVMCLRPPERSRFPPILRWCSRFPSP